VFRLGRTGAVYYLVAGRWFSAPDFTGPWTFATLTLPGDFQKIPLEHPRSRVLASVPGTQQAAEAVLLAQVPQTARINKKQIKAPEVAYQGDPSFKPIEKTSLQYAENTDKDIIKMGDLYYMCFQGVWFMSRTATGPWEVCESVPKEIYSIPASSPVHNVTYVTVVEEDHTDEWVTVATVAAYGKTGDSFRFYEINPLVTRFAREYFTFLRDCPSRVEIVSGDARIALEDEPPQKFDVLIVDAFSGDAIPVHLLTREALNVYMRQIQPQGALAFHITNAYLDLAPMVGALVRERGLHTALVTNPAQPHAGEIKSDWILATANDAFFASLRAGDARPVPKRMDTRVWTDDYSNLLRVLAGR
jgi:hypothetical protein